MSTLRRAIRYWLHRAGWRHDATTAAGISLARDLGLPPDAVSRILDQTAAELRELSEQDEAGDARPIINKAIEEIAKFGYHPRPCDEEVLDQFLDELAEPDISILRHFKQGMKHRQIADLMGTDVDSVRRSLVKTYSDLRMRMMGPEDEDGEALVGEEQNVRVSSRRH